MPSLTSQCLGIFIFGGNTLAYMATKVISDIYLISE